MERGIPIGIIGETAAVKRTVFNIFAYLSAMSTG
jgi:hypothetical protein